VLAPIVVLGAGRRRTRSRFPAAMPTLMFVDVTLSCPALLQRLTCGKLPPKRRKPALHAIRQPSTMVDAERRPLSTPAVALLAVSAFVAYPAPRIPAVRPPVDDVA